MGCATHYIITDGKRYIGVDSDTKENIIVESYKKAVKLRFTQVNAIYNKLAEDLLKDGEWKIISTIEVKNDLSEDIEIDVDSIMESLEADFDLLVKRKKVLELELILCYTLNTIGEFFDYSDAIFEWWRLSWTSIL